MPEPPARSPVAVGTMAALSFICFLSGASALIFEGLWFRLAGLSLGNSVWATSLVVASFMAGLGLGNALTARHGWRLARPLRGYAALEGAIALFGLGVVLALPAVTPGLAALFRLFLDGPALLNATRLAVALLIMLVPATAMGATLPLVVASVSRGETPFGRTLGWIYGWNTLGGFAGALLGETVLVGAFGLRGAGAVAAALNLVAAASALLLSRRTTPVTSSPPTAGLAVAGRFLAAAALAGGIFLALEVVWFRFLVLFVHGTSVAFAVMLAVVLLGIGAGGLIASVWLARDPGADRWLPSLGFLAGAATVFAYAFFAPPGREDSASRTFLLSARLMLVVSVLSGIFFSVLGQAVRRGVHGETDAAGRLILANTLGATVGALLAGFLMLPRLGIERSLFMLALAYAASALCCLERRRTTQTRASRYGLIGSSALFAIAIALFPFGIMRGRHLRYMFDQFVRENERVAALREGLTETIVYLETRWGDAPIKYTLLTNGHSMSSTAVYAQRYMKLYVYWALAVRPQARKALLLCYGVGNTAKALVDSAGLEAIDVVDISRDVLALSHVPYPPPRTSPLLDPRVRVHVEDGRFFLLSTGDRFDLITAEPPPPKNAGVVNLYSREYFALLRDRLAEGGVVTYWLPVYQLDVPETKAILRAFCSAFPDCSLWSGAGEDWMMAGRRESTGPVTADDVERQWKDPIVGPELRALALEGPEDLGALFIADATQIAGWVGQVPPLEDDRPKRLSATVSDPDQAYREWARAEASRRRFEESAWIARLWPASLRAPTRQAFEFRQLLDDQRLGQPQAKGVAALRRVLEGSSRRTLPLLLMNVEPVQRAIAREAFARGVRHPGVYFVLGSEALSEREYGRAAEMLQAAQEGDPTLPIAPYRILALTLSGRREEALRVAAPPGGDGQWAWIVAGGDATTSR